MRTSLVEIILTVVMVFFFFLIMVGMYNSAVSEKTILNKSEWVCTKQESKVSTIGGNVIRSNECVNYVKVK